MSNQLTTFHFEEYQIQSHNLNNELFLRATQLAEILGYKNPCDAIKTHVDKEDVVKRDTLTKGGKQKVLYVNEGGMYALIFGSSLDSAKRFKKWVTSEVLPTIRKTGSYSLTISTEQQQAIKQAVNERAYRTREHHQSVYHKLYAEFKIPRYQDLPSSKFDEAIKFLGGVSSRNKLSDNELYKLARLVFVANYMREKIQLIEPALRLIDSSYRAPFYSMGVEFKHEIEDARLIIMRETNHITTNHFTANWNAVLPVIRQDHQLR